MKVRIERSKNRILLDSDRPTQLRDFPGAYFRDGDKVWSLPLDLTTCHLLRERFGVRLLIGPMLRDWAIAEKASRAAAQALASSADAEVRLLPEVAPKLAQAMESRKYQRVATRFVADSMGRDGRRRALLADTVGLGKTAESLAGVLESGEPGPYLVLCPKTPVNTTWKAEINRWLPGDQVVTIPDGRAKRDSILNSLLDLSKRAETSREPVVQHALDRTWVVLHYAAIRTQTWWICPLCGSQTKYTTRPTSELDCGHPKGRTKVSHEHEFPQIFGMEWGGVIVDESDQVLIRLTGTPNLQRRGAEMLRDLVRPGGARIAMSGTPHRSKPHQIWSTLNWLDPVRFSSKWSFLGKYWETESGFFGGTSINGMKPGMEEMLESELSDIMLRRTRAQVRPDLPAKLYAGTPLEEGGPVGVWIGMSTAQQRAYDALMKQGAADIVGGTLTPSGVLAEMTRLRQLAGAEGEIRGSEYFPRAAGGKYEWLISFLKELGFPGEPATKVAIASQFTKLLKVFGAGIVKELGMSKESQLSLDYITGEETQAVRDANIADFEEGSMNVILLNTKAGGSSITLDAAEIMIILDETWVDDDQEQLEGRIDNRNPEKRIVPRTYYYLRARGTIEEGIARANLEAKAAGKRLLDGGPLALARKVLVR